MSTTPGEQDSLAILIRWADADADYRKFTVDYSAFAKAWRVSLLSLRPNASIKGGADARGTASGLYDAVISALDGFARILEEQRISS